MGQSYDIEEIIAGQLSGLSAQQIADNVMSAVQGHPNEAEALRLLAQHIRTRRTQIQEQSAGVAPQLTANSRRRRRCGTRSEYDHHHPPGT